MTIVSNNSRPQFKRNIPTEKRESRQTRMIETRVSATLGLLLTISSILLGPQFWGYETGVLVLQTGILTLGLGLFMRINRQPRMIDAITFLEDIEV